MKITINIDCTPEEARRYMGLPDLAPMQENILKVMEEKIVANVTSMQPFEMMKTWMPMDMDNWLNLQKAFWTQMTSVGRSQDDSS